jgi:protein-disulfide isomerase
MKFATTIIGILVLVAALTATVMSRRTLPITDLPPATLAITQQRAMEKVVRNYILENPEILPEAIRRLEQKQITGLLGQVREELETPFHGAIGGNPKGDVTLMVFFDYRCPYCHQAKQQVDALIAADPNLRVVYRDYPILDAPGREPMSRMAAALSLAAAKQNKYVAFHDALFAASAPMSQETLVKAARTARLDERTAVANAGSKEVADAINRNVEIGRLLGLSGTPAYVIGNQVLTGGDKVEQLPDAIARLRS